MEPSSIEDNGILERSPQPIEIDGVRYIVSPDQLNSISVEDLNVSPQHFQGFWGINTYNERLTTPSDTLLYSCCPLFIGPCCNRQRRSKICNFIKTFTFWLILIQIGMYIFLLYNSVHPLHDCVIDNDILIKYGALNPSKIFDKYEFWRFITTVAVHGHLTHLFVNVLIEFCFFPLLEINWNTVRVASVFFLSSVAGGVFTLSFSTGKSACGSSNGIFGEFGAFCSYFLVIFKALEWRYRIGALLLMLLLVLSLIWAGVMEGLDNMGHIGGSTFGIAFGFIIFAHKAETNKWRLALYVVGIVACIIDLAFPVFNYLINMHIINLDFLKSA